MPKMTDPTELDEELEEEEIEEGAEEEDEDEDEEAEEKPRSTSRTSAKVEKLESTLEEIKSMLKGSGGSKEQRHNVSKVEELFEQFAKGNWEPDQLKAMGQIVAALKADMTEDVKTARAQDYVANLNEQCQGEIRSQLKSYYKDYPFAKKAEGALMQDVIDKLEHDPTFAAAKTAYGNGKKPATEHFQKAAAKVMKSYLAEAGITKKSGGSDMSDQLDVRSSKPRGSKSGGGSGGDINVDDLNEFEQMIYVETLNATKDKKQAAEALKTIRGTRKLVG